MRRLAILLSFLVSIGIYASENRDLLVSTAWLQQHLLDRSLVVLEIGDPGTYESAHIPRARFVALSDLVVDREDTANELPSSADIERAFRSAGVGDRARIILYSRDPIAATRAFFTLDYAGHGDRTAILDGGFAKWAAEGRRIESGPRKAAASSNFTVRPRAEVIVHLAALKTLVDCSDWLGAKFAVIDTRAPEQFQAGRILCATNIPWQENLTGGSTPTFKPAEELKALYSGGGIADDASVVTYCRTGMQASVTYFVLRYLGRDVHLYDGSFSEWSARAK